MKALRTIELHCTTGGSDKIYKISIETDGADAYFVNFAYGRRGDPLKTGSKTTKAVDLTKATKIYDALKLEKMTKGYRPIGGSDLNSTETAEVISTLERKASGFIPQLLNPIEEHEVETYIRDPRYVAQLKYDGERRALQAIEGAIQGVNRRGETVAISKDLQTAALYIGNDFLIDGEQIGDTIYAFDLLGDQKLDFRDRTLEERLKRLRSIFEVTMFNEGSAAVKLVETAYTETEKRELYQNAIRDSREGVVFKKLASVYSPGRTPGSIEFLKFKFYKTLSAFVSRVNDKRSVEMSLVDDRLVALSVGNVTIPPNAIIPQIGDIIEVRYLYAYPNGSLFQPTFLAVRHDLTREDCLESQRIYKDESFKTA